MYRYRFSSAITSILLVLSIASASSSSDILLQDQRQRSDASKVELSIRPLDDDTYNKSWSSASDSSFSPVVGEGSHLGIIEEVKAAVSTAQTVAQSELAELELETQTTSILQSDGNKDENLASLLFSLVDSTLQEAANATDRFSNSPLFLYLPSATDITVGDGRRLSTFVPPSSMKGTGRQFDDKSWSEEVHERAFSVEYASMEADNMVEAALRAMDEMKNQTTLDHDRVANETKAAILAQSSDLVRLQSKNGVLPEEEEDMSSSQRHLLQPETWKGAGYEIMDEISPLLALQIITSLPLSTYRLQNDPKEAVLVARGKSTSEMRTRRHIGPIDAEAATAILPSAVDFTDSNILASVNIKAIAALANAAETLLSKTKAIDAVILASTSNKANSLRARIQAIKDKVGCTGADGGEYKSMKQLAWEALALEAEASSKEFAVISLKLKHSVRMKILETKYATKDKLLEEQTESLGHVDATQDEVSSKREFQVTDAESDLDCVIERIGFINAAASMRNATKRDLELVSKSADAERSREWAQIMAEAKSEREQEQASLERISVAGEEKKKQAVEMIGVVYGYLRDGLNHVAYTNQGKRQCVLMAIAAALLVFAISSARESISLVFAAFQRLLTTPSLVREYGRQRWYHRRISSEEIFQDVILSTPLKDRVVSLARSARNARRHDAPYRHILLHGLPGTGKSMVAAKIAKCTGMDYALMSGGDVGPLGTDAVTQIHDLFRWAKSSRKGVLLFIDEAEAFLGNRVNSGMSEYTHNALNALLYNTGGERRDFMLVIATNRPEDLDAAVLDRCDEFIRFPLPDADCRRKLISQHYKALVKDEVTKNNAHATSIVSRARSLLTNEETFHIRIDEDVMDRKQLESIVAATDSFSGREIGKLIITMQAALYASDDGVINKDLVQAIVDAKVAEHKTKQILMIK